MLGKFFTSYDSDYNTSPNVFKISKDASLDIKHSLWKNDTKDYMNSVQNTVEDSLVSLTHRCHILREIIRYKGK